MESFLATLLFMGTIMLVMAVGVIFRNKPLKGSCGGVGGIDCLCEKEGKALGTCDLPESMVTAGPSDDGVSIYR